MRFVESCGITLCFYELLSPFDRRQVDSWAPVENWFAPGECAAGKRPSVPVHLVRAEIFDHKVQHPGLDFDNPNHIGAIRRAAIKPHEMLVADDAIVELDGKPVRSGIGGTLVGLEYMSLDESRFYRNFDAMLPLHVRHAPPPETADDESPDPKVFVALGEFTFMGQRPGEGWKTEVVIDGGWHRIIGRADTSGANGDICRRGREVCRCEPIAVEHASHFPHLQAAFMQATA